MSYRKCEICRRKSGREDGQKRFFMARYPLDVDRCKLWVKLTGKEDLAYVPIEKLHELKFVCGIHFKDEDFKQKKTQLKKSAVPTLKLTASPLSDDILVDFPCKMYKEGQSVNKEIVPTKVFLTTDHNYSRKVYGVGPSQLKSSNSTLKSNVKSELNKESPTSDKDNNNELMEQQSLEEPDQVVIEDDDVIEDLMYEDSPKQSKESLADEVESDLHVGYKCNVCESDIRGFRYVCVQCSDWDMCGGCEARGAHSQHYVLRLPGARPQNEILSVLDRIRRELMQSVSIEDIIKKEEDTEDPLNEVMDDTEAINTSSELLDEQLNRPLIFEDVVYLKDFETEESESHIQDDTQKPSVSHITNSPLSARSSASNITSSVPSARVSSTLNTNSTSSARLKASNINALSTTPSISNIQNNALSARLSAPNITLRASDNSRYIKSNNPKGPRLKNINFKGTESKPIVKLERSALMKLIYRLKSTTNCNKFKIRQIKGKD